MRRVKKIIFKISIIALLLFTFYYFGGWYFSKNQCIQETLRGLMYHNLGKIKPIYKDVLDIDLGDIGDIMTAVQIRHDIIHRSGKDKDGNLHNIQKEDVIDLVEKVSSLISKVDMSINPNPFIVAADADNEEVELPFD